jgi:hypothetical protein
VLTAIVPVAGPSRIVSAAPEVATVLEDDVEAALEEPNDRGPRPSRSRPKWAEQG